MLPWSDWLDDVDPEEEVAVWLVCTPWITCVCCTAPVPVEGADPTPDPPSTWTWVMTPAGDVAPCCVPAPERVWVKDRSIAALVLEATWTTLLPASRCC